MFVPDHSASDGAVTNVSEVAIVYDIGVCFYKRREMKLARDAFLAVLEFLEANADLPEVSVCKRSVQNKISPTFPNFFI